nr:hypothetical protein [Tanacetum cinerariifolium]
MIDLVVVPFRWPPRVTLGRLLPHARGLGFKPRREAFPSGAKKEWGLSPKVKVRVLHTAQLDVTHKILAPFCEIIWLPIYVGIVEQQSLFHRRFILRFDEIDFQEAVEQVIMHLLMLGMKGIDGRGLSDHVAARVVGVRKARMSQTRTLDGEEFTNPKVSRKITSILKTMFNGSWITWKEVDKSARDELWAHFKELFKWEGLSDVSVHDAWENSMKKRYPYIMLKAGGESVKLAWTAGV